MKNQNGSNIWENEVDVHFTQTSSPLDIKKHKSVTKIHVHYFAHLLYTKEKKKSHTVTQIQVDEMNSETDKVIWYESVSRSCIVVLILSDGLKPAQ